MPMRNDALVLCDIRIALWHRLLHLDRAAHRVDDAGELHLRSPSPVVLTMRPWCSAELRLKKLTAQGFEALEKIHPGSALGIEIAQRRDYTNSGAVRARV